MSVPRSRRGGGHCFAKAGLPTLAATVLALATSAQAGEAALIGSVTAIGAIWVGVVVGVVVFARSVRIVVDDSVLRLTGWRGREKVVPRQNVGGLTLREVRGAGPRARPLFILYDRQHRCLAAFDRRLWPEQEIQRLEALLCHGRQPRPRTTTAARLAQEFPGSVSWWRLHGTLVAAVTVLTVTLVIPITVVAITH